jgi:dihydroorotate dehydrogenase electron transfer subunit
MPVDAEASILFNKHLSFEYHVLGLSAPEIAAAVAPGQFVMIRTSHGSDPLLRRPFSVFEVLRDEAGRPLGISILSKRVGVGTGLLYESAPGARLSCLGPLGRPFSLVNPPQEAWMVAGGVGLAPFALLAESLQRRGTSMALFYGGRSAADLFYLDAFERRGARLVLATEDGSLGERGLVTAPLDRQLAGCRAHTPLMIYACGPEPMLAAVAALAETHRRPAELSMERVMGCGMGGCYSCVVRVRDAAGEGHYVRSCIEGPVFRAGDLVWD